MTPHPYGEDFTYPVHPVIDAGLPLGWETNPAGRTSGLWKFGVYCFREYFLSSLFFIILAAGLFCRAGLSRVCIGRTVFCWRINAAVKRLFDIFAAGFGLVIFAPIFLFLPLVIKLDSPGPVFFRQLRVGKNRRGGDRRSLRDGSATDRRYLDRRRANYHGRPFEIIKFRTMVQDAEKKCGPVWATSNDPRITRLGRFLRKTRLDELPQLINVLKGEMSLVGPRPERPFFTDKLAAEVPGFLKRLTVPPGITGLAQVKNGYDSSVDDVRRKVHYDLSYIRGWNLTKDIKILLSTITVVLTGRGAC